jgi:glycosyltransferase involved in cell wall biosynthesis
MNRTNVMHIVDTLALGGAERVAMTLANMMPRDRYQMHLCTTRAEGPLASAVRSDVGRLALQRQGRWDVKAARRLGNYIREHQVEIVHAHGTSILTANVASLFRPHPKMVWHDHYGRNVQRERPVWLFRLLTSRVAGVFAVSDRLANWSRERLRFPSDRVEYLPNFVEPCDCDGQRMELPGQRGKRIISVANLRPVKDHPTLIQAMAAVVKADPEAHLLLVGAEDDTEYAAHVRELISKLDLQNHVSLLGKRQDVRRVLGHCDVGVVSSTFEGLPISLLEYGAAGLPAVVTNVGQCADVINNDEGGIVVPSEDAGSLGEALTSLLKNNSLRESRGTAFKNRIERFYSPQASLEKVHKMYSRILAE